MSKQFKFKVLDFCVNKWHYEGVFMLGKEDPWRLYHLWCDIDDAGFPHQHRKQVGKYRYCNEMLRHVYLKVSCNQVEEV